ncbi:MULTISPECIES: ABC transporter permease [unclassified Xanthomonas]|uniref:ABC transporter permease n=1 Tax=unclassified Xanthomonas TaxID=2643310 RepID=UPI0025EF1E89|nr:MULTISPECIES: ABC transporter permease [unclassified Xanthomonas]MDY4294403.1 ABC transporter permease [Xanthomonas sp. LF02-5]MDY4357099.1 ABC transporter permease [Xanthomonas sp. LF04-12]
MSSVRLPARAVLTSPLSMARSFLANRALIYQLAKREVISRYRGSLMGLAWSFFNPLLMLAVYTFVFSVVFNARWGQDTSHRGEFAIILFVGILVHGIFAECVNRAPTLIIGNASYVKRVVFPLETLPWVAMGAALFHALVSLAVLLIAQVLIRGVLPLTVLYFPLVLLPLVLFTMGLAWLFSALGVFVRDIGQMTGILTTILMFLAPVFYPVSALPEGLRKWIYLNPLTFIIEQARDVLVWGNAPDFVGLTKYFVFAMLVACFGYLCFRKMRRGFADVI